jgi:hypothetical protein
MLKPDQVREICDEHDTYWNHRRDRLREARNLYLTRYWQHNQPYLDGVLRTEVPKAYQVVESYVGSLYAKDPGVIVGPDLRGRGNPEVAQATANQYLRTIREQIEDATRLALIYPCAFLKLAPVESVDPLKRVSCSALPPWEVIVDATATSWSAQRWVGHVYLVPVSEAAVRYGRRKSSFNGRRYYRWIESFGIGGADNMMGNDDESDVESWVKVVEIYDLHADKLLVWSPDYKDGSKFLFRGVTRTPTPTSTRTTSTRSSFTKRRASLTSRRAAGRSSRSSRSTSPASPTSPSAATRSSSAPSTSSASST